MLHTVSSADVSSPGRAAASVSVRSSLPVGVLTRPYLCSTRLLNWRISLLLLLAVIVAVIPLAYSLVLSYRSTTGLQDLQRPTLTRLVLTALPASLFLFLLSFIPLPAAHAANGFLEVVFARLTVVGTVILGLLSGFGAVSNAWTFFPVLSRSAR